MDLGFSLLGFGVVNGDQGLWQWKKSKIEEEEKYTEKWKSLTLTKVFQESYLGKKKSKSLIIKGHKNLQKLLPFILFSLLNLPNNGIKNIKQEFFLEIRKVKKKYIRT